MYAYSGEDGSYLGGSDPRVWMKELSGNVGTLLLDTNGDGTQELFVFTDADFVGDATRQVTAYQWSAQDQVFQLQWIHIIPDPHSVPTVGPQSLHQEDTEKEADDLVTSSFVPGERLDNAVTGCDDRLGNARVFDMRALALVSWDEARKALLMSTSPVQETPAFQPMAVLRKGGDDWENLGAIEEMCS